jgi:hypothetical protein
MTQNPRETTAPSLGPAVRLVRRICRAAGRPSLIDDARVGLARHGVIGTVQRRDTPAIFDWLIDALSYQGVSDSIAYSYMEQHGRVRWRDIASALAESPSCPKLTCYWAFEGCGYRKGSGFCANPEHQPECPLPRHDLRNGRLNQTAYSLFLFMRDLAGDNIVSWIDDRLARVEPAQIADRRGCARHCSSRSGIFTACRTSCWRCRYRPQLSVRFSVARLGMRTCLAKSVEIEPGSPFKCRRCREVEDRLGAPCSRFDRRLLDNDKAGARYRQRTQVFEMPVVRRAVLGAVLAHR